jgi:hypothetical protein
MNEEKDPKPEGREQDFTEFARHTQPKPGDPGGGDSDGWGRKGSFARGCAIAFGVVALIFFLIVGTCFLSLSRW